MQYKLIEIFLTFVINTKNTNVVKEFPFDIKGRLVIGATGFVEGEIICGNCDVSGKIIGKITVAELLSLKASANIQGDMITKKLSIEPGAMFTGTCKMNGKQGIQSFSEKSETKDKSQTK